MRKSENSQLLNTIVFILLCIPFFLPEGLGFTKYSNILRWMTIIQKYEAICLFLYVSIFYIKHLRYIMSIKYKKRFSMFMLVLVLAFLQVFCTWLNDGDYSVAINRICVLIGSYALVEIIVFRNPKKYLKMLMWVFCVATIINILVIFALYNVMGFRSAGDFWLFGQKNAMRNIVIPAVTLSTICDRIDEKKFTLRTITLCIVAVLSLVLVKSGASIVVMIIFIAMLLYLNITDFEILNIKKIGIFYIVLEILIVFFRRMDLFSSIIGVLGKNLTLSDRTFIWDNALALIQEQLWFGDGLRTLENSRLAVSVYFSVSHAHNALLDILFKCGIVGTVIMIGIVIKSIHHICVLKKNALASILGMAIGAFLIAGLVGELWNFGFFIVLFIAYYIGELVYVLNIDCKTIQKRLLKFRISR